MEFNVADLLEYVADLVPEREALVCGHTRLSYAEFDRRANRVAHHLASVGVGTGDHVGIYAYNCAEWMESMLGCYKIRAVPININYRYVEDELRYLFDNADLVALIHQQQFSHRIEAVRGALPRLRHTIVLADDSGADYGALGSVEYEKAVAQASPERGFEPRSGDDLYLLYTGGTTGMPKGVMWRQHDVIFALGGGIDHATGIPAERPEDLGDKSRTNPPLTMLISPPLMHGAAQWGNLTGLFVGNKIVLNEDRRFDADHLWRLVERERVNVLSITGDAMARPLVDALEAPGAAYDLSSLFVLTSTAAVFSTVLKDRLKTLLPNAIINDAIGASETGYNGMGLYQSDDKKKRAGGPRVAPGRDTLVLDEDLRPVKPGSGVVGRIARTGNIPLGYYKDPEKTAATFVEAEGVRYSIPGDFATVEEDGTLILLGRGSVSINSGGEKIYPEEVEAVLKSHPEVFDALVVGIPDERWGQRVAAVVQPRPGRQPTLEQLDRHCREHIASYKVPRALHLVEQIVRSPAGKPDYPWAQRVAEEALGSS